MSLKLGRVAACHPDDNAVDLVMLDDGSHLAGVQVMAWTASTNTGSHDLPEVETPASGDVWALTERTDRDMIAVVGFAGRHPIVMGFLFPQVSQMLFKEPNRKVMRHASDVYVTIDGEGNTELAHPSGSFLRLGTTASHEDLTGTDVDGKWAITKNTTTAVYAHLVIANAGVVKADITIDPDGNVAVIHEGNLSIATGGNTEIAAAGTMALSAGGAMSFTAPTLAIVADTATTGALTNNGKNVGSTHIHPENDSGGPTGPPV